MVHEQLSHKADYGVAPRWAKLAAFRLKKAGRESEARQLLEQHGEVKLDFGVRRRSGRLVRSLRYMVETVAQLVKLVMSIGQGAPYAEGHESRGLIAFRRVCQEEFRHKFEEVRVGLQFMARDAGRAPVHVGEAVVEDLGATGGGGERAQLLGQLRSHWNGRREAARQRRASRWRSMARGA